ncbi:MAG: hypothetical protein LBR72_07995 [Oscillospiraceae bacterium]|jgi:hypothetical protein|nr:hypothetical protein [Oscillospiraceae bacterium]
MFENGKNVFGSSDTGFRDRFDNTLAKLQTGEPVEHSVSTRTRQASSWTRITGITLATCMAAALLWGVASFLTTRTPPGDDSAGIGSESVGMTESGSNGSLDYMNITDELTPLQTIDEILSKAEQLRHENNLTRNRPMHYAREEAKTFAERIYQTFFEPDLDYFTDDLEGVRAITRFALAGSMDPPHSFDYWKTRTDTSETEIPWFDGTNADAPVVRYKPGDAPAELRSESSTQDICAAFIDNRYWASIRVERNDLAAGYSAEVTEDGFNHVFLFYLDQEQASEDDYLVVSISPLLQSNALSVRLSIALDDLFTTLTSNSPIPEAAKPVKQILTVRNGLSSSTSSNWEGTGTPDAEPVIAAGPEKTGVSVEQYMHVSDELTQLQSKDEINQAAIGILHDQLLTLGYPVVFARDMAEDMAGYLNATASEALETIRANARFWLNSEPYAWLRGGMAAQLHVAERPEREIPWFDGTNANMPLLRYRPEDAPEHMLMLAEFLDEENDIETAFFDDERFWAVVRLDRTTNAVGYAGHETADINEVTLFYLDEAEQQNENYIILSGSLDAEGAALNNLLCFHEIERIRELPDNFTVPRKLVDRAVVGGQEITLSTPEDYIALYPEEMYIILYDSSYSLEEQPVIDAETAELLREHLKLVTADGAPFDIIAPIEGTDLYHADDKGLELYGEDYCHLGYGQAQEITRIDYLIAPDPDTGEERVISSGTRHTPWEYSETYEQATELFGQGFTFPYWFDSNKFALGKFQVLNHAMYSTGSEDGVQQFSIKQFLYEGESMPRARVIEEFAVKNLTVYALYNSQVYDYGEEHPLSTKYVWEQNGLVYGISGETLSFEEAYDFILSLYE